MIDIPEEFLKIDGTIKSSAPLEYREQYFLNKAKKKHGDRYDYSKVRYNGAKNKVIITCKIHGDFSQKPNAHLNGNGCPKCCGKQLTTEEVVSRFRKIRGNTYDYSKVEYCGAREYVIITCKLHGDFKQTPNNHLEGDGCPTCAGKDLNTKRVIANLRKVHGYTYDYSLIDFKGTRTKLTIICKKHGVFFQRYHDHLKGHGCQKCSCYTDTFYVWKYQDYIKVGVTSSKREYARIMEVCAAAGWCFDNVEVLCYRNLDDPMGVEKRAKQLLSNFRAEFTTKFDGCSEVFKNVPTGVLMEVLHVV